MKKTTTLYIVVIWAGIILASFYYNQFNIKRNKMQLARGIAASHFSEIALIHLWNASHGGIYVPVTPTTQPNPYLDSLNRDFYVESADITFTKVNPAYMTRQLEKLVRNNSNISFQITSLNPIRPDNKADAWETEQLKKFKTGKKESFEYLKKDTIYRYMAPLTVKQECLNCHKRQGYKIGEIRGGINVNINASFLNLNTSNRLKSNFYAHLIILIFGSWLIILFQKYSRKKLLEIQKANSQIKLKNQELTTTKKNIKKTAEELVHSNFTKDRMFSIIAHDLKAPISTIIGISNLQIDSIYENDIEEVRKLALNINNESKKVFDLLLNLLDWAQTQTKKIQIDIRANSINEVIDSSIKIYQSHAASKNIKILKTVTHEITANFDKQMIFTVIRNLLSNAIKFTDKNGKISISAFVTKDEHLEVFVKDSGTGMNQDEIDKLFIIEEQVLKEGTQNESGTGLGLILCKEFINLHGGNISVHSRQGKGSTFSFNIPAKAKQ